MNDVTQADVIVIGAGIAGAGVAAHLAEDRRVIVLERESFAGRHSTGRSAALFSQIYGGPAVRALSQASKGFLFDPPEGFADVPLTRARRLMMIADAPRRAKLEAFAKQSDIASCVAPISVAEARAWCPILRDEAVSAAIVEGEARDIDVDALHQGYLRQLRTRGGRLLTDAGVTALVRSGSVWKVWVGDEVFEAPCVINAAGAWADEVATSAGVAPIGLSPLRRTAVLVDGPAGVDVSGWPLVMDVEEQCYFKPESGRLLLSPADETPSAPCDAQPESFDIALAIDCVQQIATLDVARVVRSWAGLRSFVADRAPVAGFDPEAPGFFWLAGQGGYGIQTAPALSRTAAALLRGEPLPEDVSALGLSAAALSPERLAQHSRAPAAAVGSTSECQAENGEPLATARERETP